MKKHLIQIAGLMMFSLVFVACQSKESSNISGSIPGGANGEDNSNGTASSISRPPQVGGNFLAIFPTDRILSGGVPKDGIPALTDPAFVSVSAAEAGYLRDDDLVLGVVINGEAKAYPHNMGWWHEIINDRVGGHPVVVSFCPLTSTGLVFDGGSDLDRLTCGVSGLLFNNNLIMYDRRDDSTLYPQMIHTPVNSGSGTELTLLPVIETTWRYWKLLYPNSQVISVETGLYAPGRYAEYPYGGYRSPSTPPSFQSFPSLSDNATARYFPPKTMTLGVRFGEMAKAYPFPVMGEEAVINDTVAGRELLVVFYAQERYAVPFSRTVSGQTLTFEKSPQPSTNPVYPFMMQDKETGSFWNLKGEAVAGPHLGARLEQIPAHNAFWFAWATFWQNTGIY
jgi:hypothetical protein